MNGAYHRHAELRTRSGTVVRSWSDAGDLYDPVPWSADGGHLAISRVGREIGNRLVIASAEGDEVTEFPWPVSEYLGTVQWAPRRHRLLAVGDSLALLLDTSGRIVGSVELSPAEFGGPTPGWIDDDFFVLTENELRFFSGTDARLLGGEELDPLELVPFDADMWGEVQFDRENSRLFLSVTRPRGSTVPSWVEVELGPSEPASA